METPEPIVVVPADAGWTGEFRAIAPCLRDALGPVALGIDHVVSTALPGPAAKPAVDTQLSVHPLDPVGPYRAPLETLRHR